MIAPSFLVRFFAGAVPWKLLGGAALVAVTVAAFLFLRIQRDSALADLAVAERKLEAATIEVDNLRTLASAQNAAIQAVKTAGDERTKAAEGALARVRAENQKAQSRIDELIAYRRPDGVDECEAARKLIREEFKP